MLLAKKEILNLQFNHYDKKFGDIKLNDIGPAEFVGLIRDSQIVVTDSFHAAVFSIIYKKNFFALLRNVENEDSSMNSRITDLLSELGLSDRIVTNESQLTEEFLNETIDYTYAESVIKEKRIKSVEFLKNAFKGTEMEDKLAKYADDIKNNREDING